VYFLAGPLLTYTWLSGRWSIFSWVLPATYGTALLQDIMLRGSQPDPLLLGGLPAFGAGFVLAMLLLQRLMTQG